MISYAHKNCFYRCVFVWQKSDQQKKLIKYSWEDISYKMQRVLSHNEKWSKLILLLCMAVILNSFQHKLFSLSPLYLLFSLIDQWTVDFLLLLVIIDQRLPFFFFFFLFLFSFFWLNNKAVKNTSFVFYSIYWLGSSSLINRLSFLSFTLIKIKRLSYVTT